MKKKFTINPKLKTYSALAGSFLATGNMANASVVYHDVTPDVTKTQTTLGTTDYAIDMDNDGTTDFTLKVGKFSGSSSKGVSYAGTGVAILPSGTNGVAKKVKVSGSTSTSYALAMNANDNINNSLTWYTASGSSSGLVLAAKGNLGPANFTSGQFHNTTNKYLGVKFTTGANTYYGWIRLDVGDYNTYTLKDWAYENTANTAIMAGQGAATGVSTYLNSVTTIIATNNVVEATFANAINGNMQIVNMNGAVVKAAEVNGTACSINMNGMPTGIYNVIVSANDGTLAKKVYVE